MKKILLEHALQRETTPREGFFPLVFVKETAFFFFLFPLYSGMAFQKAVFLWFRNQVESTLRSWHV